MIEYLPNFAIILFSLTVHEYAHGWMAEKCGDDTARLTGRITLNPIPHIDPIGTIALPALLIFMRSPFLFGWARPVPINPARMDNPRWDTVKVSASGPLANIFIASVSALLLKVVPWNLLSLSWQHILLKFLSFAVIINLILAVFNLIPIHPLDGGKVISGLLPRDLAFKYESFARYGQWILLFLFITGGLQYILWPIVTFLAGLLGL